MYFTFLRVPERLCGKISGSDTELQAIFGGNFQPLFFKGTEKVLFPSYTNCFFQNNSMASTTDIARLLNVDELDSSAFADVIADYFDDRKAHVYSSSASDEDDSGIVNKPHAYA